MISEDIQSLNPDALVEMFEIDATKKGHGVMRFTSTSVSGQPIKFRGLTYEPVPVKAEGFSWSSGGTLPRPTLELAIPDHAFFDLGMLRHLTGCEVTRLRTFRKYLDDGTHPNPNALFPPEVYAINRRSSETKTNLVYELTPKMDRERRVIPAIQVLRDSCKHKFRQWDGTRWRYEGATCPYAGAAMYDVAGRPTDDPTVAACGKLLTDCEAHFGKDAVLPMWAFMGVGRL